MSKSKYKNSSSNSYVCCLSEDDRMQLECSKKIDRELAAFKRRFRATQKIVLLGAGESGKSTFLKQMQIIHGNGFSYDDKLLFRTQIYENIIKGIAGLINGKRDLQIPWKGSSFNGDSSAVSVEIAVRMRPILQHFSTIYRSLMEEREMECLRLNKRINITPEQFSKCVNLVIDIWNDNSIKEAYERRREFPKYFVENIPYFIDNLERIARQDYMPDSADILRSRRATTGINEIEMDIKNVPFQFVDVGGQRTQRQKWQQCFSDVTAILFLASASEFDEHLREDGQTNRLEESCKVFETLINYKYLRNVEFILFLNKHDLLVEKIKKINIKNYCKDFNGNPKSINDVENYLVKKFSSLKKSNYENRPYNNNSIMYNNQTTNYINKNNSNQLRHRYPNSNSNFDSIANNHDEFSLNSFSNQKSNANNRQDQERSIYSHFTTAIDTNNIKTIFEMVRLMIFEKNCKAIMLN